MYMYMYVLMCHCVPVRFHLASEIVGYRVSPGSYVCAWQTHSLVHFSTACKEYVLQVGAVVKMSKWSCRILVE